MLGSADSMWAEKAVSTQLIKNGVVDSPGALSNALKETILESKTQITDSEVTLVLHHSLYKLTRTEIPLDVDKTAYHVYLKEQFHTQHPHHEEYVLEMLVKEFENRKYGFVYGFSKGQLEHIQQALDLLDLKLVALVPEHLAFYTTFERALRMDKHEYILYVVYENGSLDGFSFDTYGPLSEASPWHADKVTREELESFLSRKVAEYNAKVAKLNRLVITGSNSDAIRQDTFTKNVGAWTNPLKRIIPHFYQDYIDQIQGKSDNGKIFPALMYTDVFGAYICVKEGKTFPLHNLGEVKSKLSLAQSITHSFSKPPMTTTRESKGIRLPKELILFVVIFLVTFGLFYFIANSKNGGISLPIMASPTETPTPSPTEVPPTPTPTIEVDRATVKVQVLNGTGVAGQASSIRTILEKAGYEGITTGNAERYDYEQSEVQIRKEKAYLEAVILADITESISSPTVTELDETETVDVVIIIGKDVK